MSSSNISYFDFTYVVKMQIRSIVRKLVSLVPGSSHTVTVTTFFFVFQLSIAMVIAKPLSKHIFTLTVAHGSKGQQFCILTQSSSAEWFS